MTTSTDAPSGSHFRVRDLRSGGFAFVMATAIVATSILNSGAHILAEVMFAIANVTYLILIGDVVVRFVRRRAPIETGFMTLTFAAACGVLGAHHALVGHRIPALVLVIAGLAAWAVLGYTVAARVVTGLGDLTGLERVDGTWFLWAVATQSVAVSCGAYATHFSAPALATLAALCWSVGLVQFILIASIVFARLALIHVKPEEPVSPYWIFMGCAAITILAGAEILGLRTEQSLLETHVVATVSMILWSFATWLIPLLVGLFIWQQRRATTRFRFQPPWWSMVFPIGMYGESSRQLGRIRGTDWLENVGQWESWIALAVWAAACAMAVRRLIAERRRARPLESLG